MKIIYKYPINTLGYTAITLPINYKILKIAEQRQSINLWAEIDTDQTEFSSVGLLIVGTGHEFELPSSAEYLDTVFIAQGNLVYHIYKITN